MSIKQNLHTHTTYTDGKNTPEEVVLEALARGFDSVGFSEHSYLSNSSSSQHFAEEKMEQYKKEIKDLKLKYKGKIDLYCGLEYDFYSDVNTEGLDYLIGSVHCLNVDGEIKSFDRGLGETVNYINDNFDGDGMAFAKKYYETVSRLSEKKNFDIIGHFDLITKNNEKGLFLETTSREYLNMGFEAIHALKGKIPFFEVNTGAISRGYRSSPYPQMDFLKEFNHMGFGAVITSDCHNKSFIDSFYDDAKMLLIEAGFKSIYVLTDNGFKEIGL